MTVQQSMQRLRLFCSAELVCQFQSGLGMWDSVEGRAPIQIKSDKCIDSLYITGGGVRLSNIDLPVCVLLEVFSAISFRVFFSRQNWVIVEKLFDKVFLLNFLSYSEFNRKKNNCHIILARVHKYKEYNHHFVEEQILVQNLTESKWPGKTMEYSPK